MILALRSIAGKWQPRWRVLILGVNAFDQPNVESSKKITKAKIADYQKKGKLKEGKPAWKKGGVAVYSPTAVTGASLKTVLNGFLKKAKKGGYVAVNAYLPRNAEYGSHIAADAGCHPR
jgi:transaldolase / glucose-6-phosphate isomerase